MRDSNDTKAADNNILYSHDTQVAANIKYLTLHTRLTSSSLLSLCLFLLFVPVERLRKFERRWRDVAQS